MPLIVPGLMTNSKDKAEEWQLQLMGKKLGDASDSTTFARKDLPTEHRVIREGDVATLDHKPDRLNIHLAADGTITGVKYG